MRWATVSCSKGPVVLTREHGKNEELESLLKSKNIETLILPMVETAKGPDRCVHCFENSHLVSVWAAVIVVLCG